MDYNLGNMEPNTFEALAQSLFQGILGPTCKVYGRGADGQREAVCEIGNPQEVCGNQVSGRTFLQAKHKYPTTSNADFSWLKNMLKNEFDGFAKKKVSEPDFLPQNYFFFTNLVLTPPKDNGIKDKIDKYVQRFKAVVPNIFIVGYDEICTMLDNNRDVRQTYFSFLVSGDILDDLYKWMLSAQEKDQKEIGEALLRLIEKEYMGDMYSRLEQAGDLNESRVSLEKVFVDLEAAPQGIAEKSCGAFISHMISVGNTPLKSLVDEKPPNNARVVLLGGAGQGKSTIGQFLAQIYRATLLKRDNTCKVLKEVDSFVNSIKEEFGYEIKCLRIPIRIILKDYAAWIGKSKETAQGVLDYIVYKINSEVSAKCDVETLRKFLGIRSWAFIFDGLDEVPTSSNRSEVLERLSFFIDIELRRLNSDALIMATTRQQGYTGDFSTEKYSHLHLLEMDDNNCLKYLDRLTTQMESSIDSRKQMMDTLADALNDPIVSKLMRRPLHASIVTILVRSGGKPPQDKYALFKEYTEIIIKRERQKNISKVLNEYEKVIIEIHEAVAYILQEQSSKPGNPAAIISLSDFASLVNHKIIELEPENEKNGTITKEVFDLSIKRLSYLAEVRDGEIEFPIRSVQEFFTANFLIKNRPEKEIIEIVQRVASSGYWRNVFVFMTGCFIKERSHLEATIDSICGELNGSKLAPGEYDENKASKMGSLLAMDLLSENIFAKMPSVENKYINHLAKILELTYVSPFARKIATLPQNCISKFTNVHLKPFLQKHPSSKPGWDILWHLVADGNQIAVEVAKCILVQSDADINTIISYFLFSRRNIQKEFNWLIPYVIDWLKKGNVFNSKIIVFLGSASFIDMIKENETSNLFIASLVKSVLIDLINYSPYTLDNYEMFQFRDIRLSELVKLICEKEYAEVNSKFKLYLPIISLNDKQKRYLRHINTVFSELKLVFFEKWSNYLITPSLHSLQELIVSFFLEDESIRRYLAPFFNRFVLLNTIFKDFLQKDLSFKYIRNYIEENYNTTLQAGTVNSFSQICFGL